METSHQTAECGRPVLSGCDVRNRMRSCIGPLDCGEVVQTCCRI